MTGLWVIDMSHELDLHIEELREVSEDNPEEMDVVIEMMMEAEDEVEEDVTIEEPGSCILAKLPSAGTRTFH